MFAEVMGEKIFYETVGEGPAVVFVHGLGGTGNVWFAQRQALGRFFKVVTLDLPGSGRSDRSRLDFSMDRWADQVAGLADVLGLGKFTLVGHSMATILAQKCAARHSSRFDGLVLCGALTELPASGKDAFRQRQAAVLQEGMIAVADLVLGGALTPATMASNPVLAGFCREMLLANDPAAYAAQCGALIAGSARAEQMHIRCPTLVMLGDQDFVTPLSMAREIVEAIPGARLRIVPATAHLTMAERPDFFQEALVQFLAGL